MLKRTGIQSASVPDSSDTLITLGSEELTSSSVPQEHKFVYTHTHKKKKYSLKRDPVMLRLVCSCQTETWVKVKGI